MNDQTNMAQLRYLEELKISLVHAGFEPERIEDQHLPVRWENHYLCRVSGRGSVLYRQENVDGIGAQDALQTVINTVAMTAEYMTAMERAPKLQATGLEGDYRILADFGDAVLAGHPTERGVQFVTWEWDWDRKGVHHGHYFQNGYHRIGVVHFTGPVGRKHPRIAGVFGVLLLQKLHGIPRDGHLADGAAGLGAAQNEPVLRAPAGLPVDGDGAVGFIKAVPLERGQLALAQPADRFRIEHRERAAPLGGIQIRADVIRVEYLHLLLFDFGDDAAFGGIAENERLPWTLFTSAMESIVDEWADKNELRF